MLAEPSRRVSKVTEALAAIVATLNLNMAYKYLLVEKSTLLNVFMGSVSLYAAITVIRIFTWCASQ